MNSKNILAVVGLVAIIILGIYFINESSKSDVEKFGDSLENAAEDVADAIKDESD